MIDMFIKRQLEAVEKSGCDRLSDEAERREFCEVNICLTKNFNVLKL